MAYTSFGMRRLRRRILGRLGALVVAVIFIGVFWITFTTNGRVRRDLGLWTSPCAVFCGRDVAYGEAGTNVAATTPSRLDRWRLMNRYSWTEITFLQVQDSIPWYGTLILSRHLASVLPSAKSSRGSDIWLTATFSSSTHGYTLFYDRQRNVLWIVQERDQS